VRLSAQPRRASRTVCPTPNLELSLGCA
jgi:hypothetical protein